MSEDFDKSDFDKSDASGRIVDELRDTLKRNNPLENEMGAKILREWRECYRIGREEQEYYDKLSDLSVGQLWAMVEEVEWREIPVTTEEEGRNDGRVKRALIDGLLLKKEPTELAKIGRMLQQDRRWKEDPHSARRKGRYRNFSKAPSEFERFRGLAFRMAQNGQQQFHILVDRQRVGQSHKRLGDIIVTIDDVEAALIQWIVSQGFSAKAVEISGMKTRIGGNSQLIWREMEDRVFLHSETWNQFRGGNISNLHANPQFRIWEIQFN